MRAFQSHSMIAVLGMLALNGCAADSASARSAAPVVGQEVSPELDALAGRALDDPRLADPLRAEGPAGLAALMRRAEAAGRLDARLDPLIDRVAAQRYARYSGLYWYTDLEQAKARATSENKPILSLRLLGDLRDDLSCANSRYFRVVLYPDPLVHTTLRSSFVLHWSSERPVPKVTVDYGDGRKLVRTVTGNSIHYVLDARGRPIDAVPGLMSANAFVSELYSALELARELGRYSDSDSEFTKVVRARHAERELTLLERYRREFGAAGVTIENRDQAALKRQNDRLAASIEAGPENPVAAAIAGSRASAKVVSERPVLTQVVPRSSFLAQDAREKGTLEVWSRVAERQREEARLSEPSRELMRELAPRGFDVQGQAVPIDEAGFSRLVDAFERVLALDTVRNQLELKLDIHQRLAVRPRDSFAELNRWVYSTVFLTPRSDPWLGLTADSAFTALPEDGIAARKSSKP